METEPTFCYYFIMNTHEIKNRFFIAAYEAGAEHTPVPTWASQEENPVDLDETCDTTVQRIEVNTVPGAFQLLDVLTKDECDSLIKTTDSLGYTEDASVSLPRSVRHNENFVWVVDDSTHDIIWERCKTFMQDDQHIFAGKKPLGLNKRFRFYKYAEGDFFRPHTDGAWPGSSIIDRRLINDAYPDRFSQMTFLILLSEDFTGGETVFYVHKDDSQRPAMREEEIKLVDIRTPAGGVLCFPHGSHPMHCLHSSADILSGVKYIIRTDVLFEL